MGAFLPAKTVSAFVNRWYPRRIIPIQLAVIVGLYLLCCGGESGGFTFGVGEVLGLVCALSLAAALVFSEQAMPGIDPVSMATAQAAVTGVLCLAAALLFDDVAVLPHVTATGWLVVAYLALLCTCLSYVLQNTALTRLSFLHGVPAAMHPAYPDGGVLIPPPAGEADGRGPHRRGHHRGLRGAGKLAERPQTNPMIPPRRPFQGRLGVFHVGKLSAARFGIILTSTLLFDR